MSTSTERFLDDVRRLACVRHAEQTAEASARLTDSPGVGTLEQVAVILAPVAAKWDTVTYAELATKLGWGVLRDTYRELLCLLNRISETEDDEGRGMLSAVVVGTHTGMPGGGFFSLARRLGRKGTDEAIWRHERELLRATWTSLNCEHPVGPGAGSRVLVSQKTADGLARTGGRRVG